MGGMEILKNVVLALHILGVVALLGGVLFQIRDMKAGTARVLPAMLHGAWTMLLTGLILVGMQYPLGRGDDLDNTKVAFKLVILVAIIVIALINRKREKLATWVLPVLGALTVANVVIATVWR